MTRISGTLSINVFSINDDDKDERKFLNNFVNSIE